MPKKGECVKVAVRVRPLSKKESKNIVDVDSSRRTVSIQLQLGKSPRVFTFDESFGPETKQIDIFENVARPIVDSVLSGYNGTIIAYGQTGSGKTYTMEGEPKDAGIIPRTFQYIFEKLQSAPQNESFLIQCSFLEIYQEEIFDLINDVKRKKMKMKMKKNGDFFVKDLTAKVAENYDMLKNFLTLAQKHRRIGATEMNKQSSRSHCILTIKIESSITTVNDKTIYKMGKLNLVDLAGSERQKRTKSEGQQFAEATKINMSLMNLGRVIQALVNPKITVIPFRESKLTMLLKDSLGGNTKTYMLVCISPDESSVDQTRNSLRYADQAKQIENEPRVNMDPKNAQLKEMQDKIDELKLQLAAKKKGHLLGSKLQDSCPENIDVKLMIQNEEEQELLKEKQREAENKKKLKEKEAHMKLQQDEITLLQKKIVHTERKIKRGERAIKDAKQLQQELRAGEEMLEKERQEHLLRRQELKKAEQAAFEVDTKNLNAEDVIKRKSEKFRKLRNKYIEKKDDLEDMKEEFDIESELMHEEIAALEKQLQKRDLILESFVPPKYLQIIQDVAKWDSLNQQWIIPGLQYTAMNSMSREIPDKQLTRPGDHSEDIANNISHVYLSYGLDKRRVNGTGRTYRPPIVPRKQRRHVSK